MAVWLQALPIVGDLIDWGNKAGERKAEIKAKKHEMKIKRLELQATMMTPHDRDYKDDLVVWFYFLSIMACFVPGIQDHMFESFERISKLPPWITGTWVAISFAIFGINKVPKLKK